MLKLIYTASLALGISSHFLTVIDFGGMSRLIENDASQLPWLAGLRIIGLLCYIGYFATIAGMIKYKAYMLAAGMFIVAPIASIISVSMTNPFQEEASLIATIMPYSIVIWDTCICSTVVLIMVKLKMAHCEA